MSKKSKRIRARNKASQQAAPAQRPQQSAADTALSTSYKATQKAALVNQEAQYKYIVPELVRIAIIGGIFFIVIIVLSFILK